MWLSGKESTCNAGDLGDSGWNPGSGRAPGGGNGNPLQYFCWENPTVSMGLQRVDTTKCARHSHCSQNSRCTHPHKTVHKHPLIL